MKTTLKDSPRKLDDFRKQINKQKLKKRIKTLFSFRVDKKTQKIILCYTVPQLVTDENGITDEKRINKEKYLKNYRFPLKKHEYNEFLSELTEFENYVISENRRVSEKNFNVVESLDNIVTEYLKLDKRMSGKKLSEKTIRSDNQSLNYFLDFFKRNNNPKLNLFTRKELDKVSSNKNIHDISEKDIILFRDRVSIDREYKGKILKKWSDTSVNSHLTRIKVFFNFIQQKRIIDTNPFSHINIGRAKSNDTIFTETEIFKIGKFISEKKNDIEWSWFIPMLQVALATGARLSEIVYMKYSDIDVHNREWKFVGKGGKRRLTRISDNITWSSILKLMKDESGNIKTNSEYVFNNKRFTDIKPFTADGVSRKFKKMIRFLELNPKLSFHACRRYFITYMLRLTKSDINLVMNLVGHSSVKMIMRYNQFVLHETDQTNIDLNKLGVSYE